ncbi:hypothetical protein GV729_24105, partial [Pseudomonas sp. Fl4BN2]|nr:hypothetical protein [Pseudomonas sp. Fl4BN2]
TTRAPCAIIEMDILARWLLGIGAMVAVIALFIAVYLTDRRAEERYGRAIEQHGASDSNTADLS